MRKRMTKDLVAPGASSLAWLCRYRIVRHPSRHPLLVLTGLRDVGLAQPSIDHVEMLKEPMAQAEDGQLKKLEAGRNAPCALLARL